MKHKHYYFLIFFILTILISFGLYRKNKSSSHTFFFTGYTMGTQYHMTVHGKLPTDLKDLERAIDTRLDEINQSMSTWLPLSEISKINKGPENSWLPVSPEFYHVLHTAMDLSEKTGGAFDVTIGPVVNLWGFGPENREELPSKKRIKMTLNRVGYQKIEIDGHRLKKLANIELDFSALAKGYGVDEIAALLDRYKIDNYSVEIGGEVVVKGINPRGEPWVIGIEKPIEGALLGKDFMTAIPLTKGAIATSGSYRNFIKEGSHIINPKTGQPIHSNLVSVTVLAPTCMEADGIATALMVMGLDAGLKWVESEPNIEALFIVKNAPSQFDQIISSQFKKALR